VCDVTLRHIHITTVAMEKQKSIAILSVSEALVIQLAKRVHLIVVCNLS